MSSSLFVASGIELFDQPHEEARRLVRTGAPVFLTVNPVEYHGPHLSLHNDRLVARGLCRDLHARLAARHPEWPLVYASDLEVGVGPCVGRGTRYVDYQEVRGLVVAACRALADLGAERVVIMSFHGQPLHSLALQAGVDYLRTRGVRALAPFNLVLRELVHFEGDPGADFAEALAPLGDEVRAEAAGQLRVDFHAGFFETSMALHYAPGSVSPRHRELPPCPSYVPDAKLAAAARAARVLGRDELARELDFLAEGVAWTALSDNPGYTYKPSLASAESGAAFARYIVDRYEPVAFDVLDGEAAPPRPVLAWAAKVSAGGRLGRTIPPAYEA